MNRSTSIYSPAITTSPRKPAPGRTRALLCYGVLAGPMYIVVGLVQALTRARRESCQRRTMSGVQQHHGD